MAIEEVVVKHAPWSISKMGVLDLCSRQYLHKYVEKVKEADKSESGRVGTALHSVLEYALANPGKPLDPVVDTVVANAALTTNEEALVRARVPACEEFVRRMEELKRITHAKAVYIEHKLGLSPAFRAVDFFAKTDNLLRGVIDYAVLSQDDVLIVIDHKSGRRKKIEEHGVQLNAYRVMMMAAVPEAKAVQCAINYIGAPRLDWAPHRDGASNRPYTRGEVEGLLHPWLEHTLNKQARKLLRLEAGVAEAETGWQCEYCGYVGLCEAGRAKVAERRARRGDPPLDV